MRRAELPPPAADRKTPDSGGSGGRREAFFLCLEAALFEQRRDLWIAPAKGAVELHRLTRVAGAIDLRKAGRRLGVERIALLGESSEAVGVQHLRPHIGVIAGGVAASGEQMLEMGEAVAHADLLRQADRGKELALI